MFTLVESCIRDSLLDRPDLGCAMLIAACQEKGIKTTLVKGQTRYLKDIFVNDSQELWSMLEQVVKEEGLKKTGVLEYQQSIQEKGPRQFQEQLRSLYQNAIVDKNARHYFNGQMIEKLGNLHRIFVMVYSYFLRKSNYTKLKIVTRYITEIVKTNPRYIGFSLHTSSLPLPGLVCRRIKELTGVPLIVGGPLTPFLDLKRLDQIFEGGWFDYLVVGAGEYALPRLIEALDSNKEPQGIANVFYRKNGKVRGNQLKVIDDLDSLPYPDYSQFDLDLYLTPKRILPLQTARGCSWRKCAFCTHHKVYFGKYRTFSVERVAETIQHLQKRYHCQHFTLHDEELPAARAKKVGQAILSKNLKDLSLYSYARLTKGYNSSRLLSQLRQAGFSTFAWGMESGCQRVLDLIGKGTTLPVMSQILKKSSANQMANLCFILFGFPGETRSEARQTVGFLKKHAQYIEEVLAQFFYLESDSPLGQNPERWGLTLKPDGSYSIKTGMSRRESNDFHQEFMLNHKLKNMKVTNDKFKYLPFSHPRRMLHFLNSSHQLLSRTAILDSLSRGELSGIFPIILGEIKKLNKKTILFPVNTAEPPFINQYHPEKGRALDYWQEGVFILSDGKLSIEEIIEQTHRNLKSRVEKSHIRKQGQDFFQELFSKNLALGFAKSWRQKP